MAPRCSAKLGCCGACERGAQRSRGGAATLSLPPPAAVWAVLGPLGAILRRRASRRVHSTAGLAFLVSADCMRQLPSCSGPFLLVRVHAVLELGWAVMGCFQHAMPTACRPVKFCQRHSPGKFGVCLLEGRLGREIARLVSAVAGARLYVCVPALTRGPSTALYCISARGGHLTSSIPGCSRSPAPTSCCVAISCWRLAPFSRRRSPLSTRLLANVC